ncbi:UDP-N-acetylmuramoyl-L-alanyl-D-glutamate--2,6-diaminopimelate ligase [Virgibacillus profundi]|uniref:UDP-N-acetylmuramoyl-L-alanyl-D-glutamate--2,6-diaminopimelate ligase n=1 Tax=Virgibacillus profundi TaxID=2024555 RepID=A0A2A2IEC3_9BACI|nr:UDP-N-acetylmuramoyl-L-alanyl-D-glutamate--2,6-diaminopimelate ligase [Virgibacillus profundi]PAV29912.1 UDP-N-acetylmuramoyl-L-alanyl-D-glutamate--2,6-diaminopimelate ligase [Virgibacillus profundi]PXY54084.1 UDP-N-acetylmuramoyl-L-alanyl-D-glutamate--2,6-diaminopimelate ligase [Virgibacillus profundi]
MKLSELFSDIPNYQTTNAIENIEIDAIEMDSQKVKSGSLFVCISGFTVDGHNYVEQAITNGAVAIVAEKNIKTSVPVVIVSDTSRILAMISAKFYNHPTAKIPLIGVTGTNGKTTVTYLLETIYNEYQMKTGVIGTIQMKIDKKTYPVSNTTPDALSLQKSFHLMLEQGVELAIMEVSSHALDLGRVFGCDFDIAVFTNLTQDHLDYHKNIDDYLHAKSLLFAQLGNTYDDRDQKFAIINGDDPSSDLIKRSTAQHVITYACKNEAQIMAADITINANGTSFKLITPDESIKINSKLIGMFNVYNMLAASAAAIAGKIPLNCIKKALESIKGVSGRFESISQDQSFAVIVDYAHTPDSLKNVLQTIKEFAKGKIYVIVGCGGDRDRSKRPLMAAIALRYADHALFTSDNPRTENPESILADMTTGLEDFKNKYEVTSDRKRAIYQAINRAKKDDIILIAGKGHETYQQIGNIKYDFDDRLIAKEAIKAKEK